MRTDPHADEVRAIVGRVFAGYLRQQWDGPHPRPLSRKGARRDGHARPLAQAKARGERVAAGFPRLYEPDEDGYQETVGNKSAVSNVSGTLRVPPGNGTRPASRCPVPDTFTFEPGEADFPELDETIMIDQGRYVARSYRVEGYLAMWLVAVGIVQFYDDGGQMLATINLFELLRPKRMAA